MMLAVNSVTEVYYIAIGLSLVMGMGVGMLFWWYVLRA